MTLLDLHALSPLIVLGCVILVLLLVVAFWRNIQLTCAISVLGLMATLGAIVDSWSVAPLVVTPLITVDGYALLFSGLIVLGSLAVSLLAFDYFRYRGGRPDEFFILLLLSTLGGMTLVASTHFASFVLGLELLSVSIYALSSYPVKGLFPLEAALKYLILSGVSSAFLLFGTALMYTVSGTLSFHELADMQWPTAGADLYFLLGGLGMILAGLMFKL
ncbi:MAG: NADH-quinone oxidoreductase subunit N, partial [Pseudomonadales bacterium]|nr:NADH-quinone oxidoreductase subunit N [Pseudomonadales bacterium]